MKPAIITSVWSQRSLKGQITAEGWRLIYFRSDADGREIELRYDANERVWRNPENNRKYHVAAQSLPIF